MKLFRQTRQKFLFTKVSPVHSIVKIVLLDFFINAALLNIYFTLNYHFIFVNKFIFLNIHISVNAVLKCFYMFFGWERGHQLSTYATGGRNGGGTSKMCTVAYRGEGVSRFMCSHALTLSLFMFLAAFLSCSVLFYLQKFNITFIQTRKFSLIQRRYVCQKRLFSPPRSISVAIKIILNLPILFKILRKWGNFQTVYYLIID